MFVAGAVLGLVLVALPSMPGQSDVGLIATSSCALLGATVLLVGYDRLPSWAFQVIVAAGVVAISFAVYYQGQARGALVVLYVAVAVGVFYFFDWKRALAQTAFLGICFGAALLARYGFEDALRSWVVTLGMIVVVGFLMGRVRKQIDWLLQQLAETARTDPVTGLLNRRGFDERFEPELDRARRGERLMSLLIGDIDYFKDVNDRLGHHAGDTALAQIGEILGEEKRGVDVIARMGGEEFGLILPDTDDHGAYALAERLRVGVQQAFENEPVPLTISFGVASFPAHGETRQDLLRAADQALYAAKALGRDRSVVHTPEIANTVARAPRAQIDGQRQLATVLAVAEALDVRDAGSARHSRDVARYAELIATELGLSPSAIERIRLAALLHDVGKVGVPDTVLRKPGPLTAQEWSVIRKHPQIAAEILDAPELADIRAWVLAHQERTDGTGYPVGLKGEEIPLEARILSVADAYEAMTAGRVYRPARSAAEAEEELLGNAGSQFDPLVVDAFLRVLGRQPTAVAAGASI